jgi:hypothetical protein
MERSDPDAVYAALRAADPDVMDRDELVELTGLIAAHKAWCEALQVRATRRQRQLADEGRSEPPRDTLCRDGRRSARDAKTADERERVCTAMPAFEDALATGTVAAGHVDAIANATRQLDEQARAEFTAHADGLLADAVRMGVDEFERDCRDLARHITSTNNTNSDVEELERQRRASNVTRWTDPATGMRHTRIVLDPIRDAQLWAAIDQARRQLRNTAGTGNLNWQQLQVDAVITAVNGDSSTSGGVLVLIDHTTLVDAVHERSVCELSDGTALPVDVVRRMACEAGIIPIVLDSRGRALDVGTSKRLATEAQRQALAAMYRTCGYPGCIVPFEACEIHHVIPYDQGGPTNLDNLLPLCLIAGHHHQVHEGGWTLTLQPDRTVTLTRPDGTVWFTGTTVDRAPAGVAPATAA